MMNDGYICQSPNENNWIIVHDQDGRRHAVCLDAVSSVVEARREDQMNGRKAYLYFNDGSYIITTESFDEIGGMII